MTKSDTGHCIVLFSHELYVSLNEHVSLTHIKYLQQQQKIELYCNFL